MKQEIKFLAPANGAGRTVRAYSEIDFNPENKTVGANFGFKPSAGKSLAIIHLDEKASATAKVGASIEVTQITNLTGFVEFETSVGISLANKKDSVDRSIEDTITRSVGIAMKIPNLSDSMREIVFSKTTDLFTARKADSKTAQKERRGGLRGNGLQQIVAQDATATEITSPLNEGEQ